VKVQIVGVVGLALIVNPKLQLNSVEEKPSFFLPQQSKQQNNFVAIIPSFFSNITCGGSPSS
jgi:hypothetical protein